ncbi:MAG: FtsW/RodA/SpoVE family cell cycle protein [Bacteroidales bacterium]
MERLAKMFKGDKYVWSIVIALMISSVLAVYSSSDAMAYARHGGNISYVMVKHITVLLVGLLTIYIFHLIPTHFWRTGSLLLMVISIPLLVITLFMGTSINDASRWLTLPGINFSFQSSDFAKIGLLMFVARELSARRNYITDWKTGFLPIMIAVAVVAALIFPANLSTAVILGLNSLILLFIGSARIKHIFVIILLGITLFAGFVSMALLLEKANIKIPVVTVRVHTWMNRLGFGNQEYDSRGADYQREQALIAIASSELIGKGPGNSVQRALLPQSYNDFIFAIIVEEYGLAGASILMALYLALLARTVFMVKNCERAFQAFLAMGMMLNVVTTAMFNMFVAVGLGPVTGQTLPLISWGGSSLLFTCMSVGILLSVSREIEKKKQLAAN